jgi:16S rRNA (cytosine967-C5)-methyltransferase
MIRNTLGRKVIHKALSLVFEGPFHADKALRKSFRDYEMKSREDQGKCAVITYAIIRSWRLLWEALGISPSLAPESFGKLCKAFLIMQGEASEDSEFGKKVAERIESLGRIRKYRESIPDWLDERGELELGDRWDDTIRCLNLPPVLTLRANTLKTTRDELRALLEARGVPFRTVDGALEALVLEQGIDDLPNDELKAGTFEIQDASSQVVSRMLAPEPGMRVVDACAGAGGKSLHLAALMKNRGKIIALDTNEKKLNRISQRAKRANATIIESRHIASTKTIKRLAGSADRLLLDVPCSGTGSLRKNPDIKWRLSPSSMDRLIEEQAHIISYYSRIVKPGGLMLYANCSVFPSEGEAQIRSFCETNAGGFSLESEKRIGPCDTDFEGFYLALIRRLG